MENTSNIESTNNMESTSNIENTNNIDNQVPEASNQDQTVTQNQAPDQNQVPMQNQVPNQTSNQMQNQVLNQMPNQVMQMNAQNRQPGIIHKKKRPFFDHPICAAITLFFVGYNVYSFAGLAGQMIIGEAAMGYVAAFAAIAMWIAYRIWFIGEFKGSIRVPSFKRKDVVIGFLVFFVVIIGCDLFGFRGQQLAFTAANLGLALMAGFGEEIMFRVFPISIMMRDWMDEKHVPVIVYSSATVFGFIHLSNILVGAPVWITLIQVVLAFGIGMFFAAVYIRSGNILLCIAMHTIHDTLCFMVVGATEGGVMQTISTFDAISSIAIGVISTMIGVILTRKSVRADIVKVWRERWSIEA